MLYRQTEELHVTTIALEPLVLRGRIAPIPAEFLHRVRIDGRDALGQPVKRVRATGGEPCRDVLRRAREGEDLILASFSPFTKEGPYHEYGPVFVLANPSDERVDLRAIEIGTDSTYLRGQFAIRAYSAGEEIVDARLVEAPVAQDVIDKFFARPDTAFVHVRFPTYGCFACRIDRE